MSLYEADELRRIADLIDRFPKFIRRDRGSTSVPNTIADILERHDIQNPALVDDLVQLTEDYRQTVATYYERQFSQ
jgi:hypothetical protein